MKKLFLWAHRGASACAPENTMAAFSAAVDCGADGIELDVHLTGDGVPVVIHDETLERTTNGAGRVNATSWQDMVQLDAGGWFSRYHEGEPVPALEMVLKAFADKVSVNIELKDFAAGLKVLEILENYNNADILVSSFNKGLLARLRQEASELPIAVLDDYGSWHKALAFAAEIKAKAFHPRVDLVTRPMVRCCREEGLKILPWTVDDTAKAVSLWRAGVDGLFTNDPSAISGIRLF